MSAILASRDRGGRARSDSELLTAIAAGELSALGDLYDRYHGDVARLLRRLGVHSADIDDVVQATFLQLPKAAGSFVGDGPCRSWISGIAVRLAHRQRRSAARFLRALAAFADTTRGQVFRDPESDAASREELAVFERALSRISQRKRDAFVLVEIEGFTVQAAADALEIPPETIRTRLFHARIELRGAMKKGGAW